MATPEAAYLYAISAGGASAELARACSTGRIPECGCGPPEAAVEGDDFLGGSQKYGSGHRGYHYNTAASSVVKQYNTVKQQAQTKRSPFVGSTAAADDQFVWSGCSDGSILFC